MDEFELIRRYFQRQECRQDVLVGIGDDGAVVAPAADRKLVAVVDTLIAGVHYPDRFPAADVGYRALAVNLSDVAAMGGTPRWMTLALTLPEADAAWLADFAAGLFEAANQYDVALIGGDTTRGAQTVISVQLLGDVREDAIMTRSGAKSGDAIYVTGSVGDAAGGLELLNKRVSGDGDAGYLVSRFARPSARVRFGAGIGGIATAAIDLSDGLGTDLEKILGASAVAGTIELESLPVSPQLRRALGEERASELALHGGDDYELCFTARSADEKRIFELAGEHDVRVTRIGELSAGAGLTCVRQGRPVPYEDRGYRHF